jgi:riboflavin biosynthesis pyrimidine reductase
VAVTALQDMGHRTVLSEGGPTMNAQLVAAGLLDELCLTLSPRLVGGDAKRILDGPALARPAELRLHSVCEDDGFLFLRHRTLGQAGEGNSIPPR